MAIIADKTYSLTWGNYFSMDRDTYSLKEKIVALRDHGLEIKTDRLSISLSGLKDSIIWLNNNVKQNPTLSQDQATSSLLKTLYNKVDQLYRHALDQEWRADEGKTSYFSCSRDEGNYDLSSFSESVSSSMVACSDNLWSPIFHGPIEVEIHLPDPEPEPEIS